MFLFLSGFYIMYQCIKSCMSRDYNYFEKGEVKQGQRGLAEGVGMKQGKWGLGRDLLTVYTVHLCENSIL